MEKLKNAFRWGGGEKSKRSILAWGGKSKAVKLTYRELRPKTKCFAEKGTY